MDSPQRTPLSPLLKSSVVLLTVLAALVFISGVRAWKGSLYDDAFITFRYVENLVDGHGFVWNIGEEPTEGYSSPLFILVLAPFELAGMPLLRAAKLIGVGTTLLGVPLLLWRIVVLLGWRNEGWKFLASLVPACWLLFHPSVIHSISGMETALAGFLYLAWIVGLEELRTRMGKGSGFNLGLAVLGGVGAFLIALIRSEGAVVVLLPLAALAMERDVRRTALGVIGVYVLLGLGYLAWKLSYFGYLLPNPFYHKVSPDGSGLIPGWRPTANYISKTLPLWLPVVAATAACLPAMVEQRLTFLEKASSLVVGFHLLFFLRVEHIMGFDLRFLWPSVPSLALLPIACLNRLDGASVPSVRTSVWKNLGIGLAGAATAVGVGLYAVDETTWAAVGKPEDPPSAVSLTAGGYIAHYHIGMTLGSLDLPYETTVMGNEAGLIPYLSGLRAIDEVGLTSNIVTRGTEEERRAYLEANPFDIFYSISTTGAVDDFAANFDFVANFPEQHREGSRARFLEYASKAYYAGHYFWGVDARRWEFVCWVRRDHPQSEEIARALIRNADRVAPRQVRFGPYDESVLESIAVPEEDPSE